MFSVSVRWTQTTSQRSLLVTHLCPGAFLFQHARVLHTHVYQTEGKRCYASEAMPPPNDRLYSSDPTPFHEARGGRVVVWL